VLAAVKQKGTALCHASENLKDDQEIALVAVRQDGMAICHVGPQMRKDPEVRGATRLRSGRQMFQDSDEWQTEDEACSQAEAPIT